MGGRDIFRKSDEYSDSALTFDIKSILWYNNMKIRCKLEGNTVVMGIPSHKEYRFGPDNNYILPVSENGVLEGDIPDLLQKRRIARACCQSPQTDLSIFELID